MYSIKKKYTFVSAPRQNYPRARTQKLTESFKTCTAKHKEYKKNSMV
jgi:hypothetical protein